MRLTACLLAKPRLCAVSRRDLATTVANIVAVCTPCSVRLDPVLRLHVLEVVEGHAALVGRIHLLHEVLEGAQRLQLALVHDQVAAQDADVAAHPDEPVKDLAARDFADGANLW